MTLLANSIKYFGVMFVRMCVRNMHDICTYSQKCLNHMKHDTFNSCNIGTSGLPDMYTRSHVHTYIHT